MPPSDVDAQARVVGDRRQARAPAATACALSRAFSANVTPVSATSRYVRERRRRRPPRCVERRRRRGSRRSSTTLCRVAGGEDQSLASTSAASASSACAAAGAARAQPATARSSSCVELRRGRTARPRRCPAPRRSRPSPVHDDVHVGLGRDVLVVAEVEHGLAVDDADAHGGHRADQRLALAAAVLAPRSQRDRVGQRHVGAGDRGGPGAAVGLQHVAVEHDGVLAQRLGVDAGAQRAADQPGDLVRAAADPALDRLAVAAGVGRRAAASRTRR